MGGLLVLSDIHGNACALRAVLEDARGWDEVLVLGDIVDYGPSPGEALDIIRGLGARVVRGNHDHAAAYGVDCRCGEATRWLSHWTRENITLRQLSKRDLEYLASLPVRVDLDLGNLKLTAVHGSPADPLYDYLNPALPDAELHRRLGEPKPGTLYLVGHTHLQFYRVLHGTRLANPGSVGQPRDGDPRAAYAIIKPETGTVEFHRVKYDVDRVVSKLEEMGVPEPYLGGLAYLIRKAEAPPRPSRPA
ncbi:MAG: metallophosphatase family protein [Desulfurococcales archaeon]|nr:metallophosphatase family protein [Desulfurococcales archaeon]